MSLLALSVPLTRFIIDGKIVGRCIVASSHPKEDWNVELLGEHVMRAAAFAVLAVTSTRVKVINTDGQCVSFLSHDFI